jgi:hypothetical protein
MNERQVPRISSKKYRRICWFKFESSLQLPTSAGNRQISKRKHAKYKINFKGIKSTHLTTTRFLTTDSFENCHYRFS